MFRQPDAAPGDEGDLVPDPFLDQGGMDLAEHVLHKARRWRADFVAVGVRHDMYRLDLRQPGQLDGASEARGGQLDPDRGDDLGVDLLDRLDAFDHRGAVRDFHQPRLSQHLGRHRGTVRPQIKRDMTQVLLGGRLVPGIQDRDQIGRRGGLFDHGIELRQSMRRRTQIQDQRHRD